MDNELDPNLKSELMSKAIRRAALYLFIAVIGFLALGFSALYLPENMMLRRSDSSNLNDWLPTKDVIPSGMILVDRYKTTNEDVAKNYPNDDEVLRLIESWGREESYTTIYLSADRCTTAGPRSIRLSIILHKDGSGAQQYLEWLRSRDRKEAEQFQGLDIGDNGYQYWQVYDSLCSDRSEKQIEIVFRRNNAQGVISITGSEGQDTQLRETAQRLAIILDESLLEKTTSR